MGRFSVSALKNRTLEVLAKNINTLLVYLEDPKNYALKKLVQRHWSNDILQRVPDNPLQTKHALFFINANLTEFPFYRFALSQMDEILQILEAQGQGISSVRLMPSKLNWINYSELLLIHLAKSLPSTLTNLQLCGKECTNAILNIAAENCPNLQQLDLTWCTEITDDGIEALFSKADQNTVMQQIDLRGTSVTNQGIFLALEHCPNMTDLFHGELDVAVNFAYDYYRKNMVSPSKTYNLKTLRIMSASMTACQVMCPHVENLDVLRIKTQNELDICGNFKDLKDVTLYSSQSLLLSPFLKIRGLNLESLTVYGNIIVSIDCVVKLCPNLVYLKINAQSLDSTSTLDGTKYCLQNLRTLCIQRMNYNFENEQRQMKTLFLNSPNLETIIFCKVKGFNDGLAVLIAMHNLHLRNLDVWRCDIDISNLNKIITAAPYINYVRIEACYNISRKQCEDLEGLRDGLTISLGKRH